MNQVTIELPDDIQPLDAKLELAFALYRKGRVTQGQAADIAGYTRRTFIELMMKHGEALSNITLEDFEKEMAAWEASRSQTAPL